MINSAVALIYEKISNWEEQLQKHEKWIAANNMVMALRTRENADLELVIVDIKAQIADLQKAIKILENV